MPNIRKLGLLDANNGYLRKQWEECGLMEFEFADDTASDYDSYDAVAADRACGRACCLAPQSQLRFARAALRLRRRRCPLVRPSFAV